MFTNTYKSDLDHDIEQDDAEDEDVTHVSLIAEHPNFDGEDTDSHAEDDVHSHKVSDFTSDCNNAACVHVLSPLAPSLSSEESQVTDATEEIQKRYDKTAFCGILVDSGFSFISTGGMPQYLAYCRT